MRYIPVISIFIFSSCIATQKGSQVADSYKILNESIYDVIEIEKGTVIFLNPRIVSLRDKLSPTFFDKEYLNDTYGKGGVLGVDPEKVLELLEKTDFEELNPPYGNETQFDIKRFDFPYKLYDSLEVFPKNALHRISEPILFNNNSFFVIYHEYYCGVECGQGNLKVFKKIAGSWKVYIKFPIWIS